MYAPELMRENASLSSNRQLSMYVNFGHTLLPDWMQSPHSFNGVPCGLVMQHKTLPRIDLPLCLFRELH